LFLPYTSGIWIRKVGSDSIMLSLWITHILGIASQFIPSGDYLAQTRLFSDGHFALEKVASGPQYPIPQVWQPPSLGCQQWGNGNGARNQFPAVANNAMFEKVLWVLCFKYIQRSRHLWANKHPDLNSEYYLMGRCTGLCTSSNESTNNSWDTACCLVDHLLYCPVSPASHRSMAYLPLPHQVPICCRFSKVPCTRWTSCDLC
jgi:hypothetical protein